jgi:hypothetical protein
MTLLAAEPTKQPTTQRDLLYTRSSSTEATRESLVPLSQERSVRAVSSESENDRTSTSTASAEKAIESQLEEAPLFRAPDAPLVPRRFMVLKAWIGEITEVTKDSVWAALAEQDVPGRYVEVVEIPFEEFAPADMPLVELGATFYWTIGYDKTPGGTLKRTSEVRMRRMPTWSKARVESIRAKASQLLELLSDDGENHTAAP